MKGGAPVGDLAIQPCPICDCRSNSTVAHPQYRQCSACGSVFQVSCASPSTDYYAEIDQAPDFSRQSGSYRSYLKRMASCFGDVSEFSLIDVGGGDGLFAQMAKTALSIKTIAVSETSEIARAKLKEQGVPIIENSDIAGVKRKIVVALQVLEHIENPEAFISSFGFRSGDYLVLTSPSVDTLYFRRYGKRWRSYAPNHHLILYSRKGLTLLLERFGIRILHYEHCVSGVHHQFDELIRFGARVLLWPIRRLKNPKFSQIQLFHGKSSFLAIGVVG